MKNKFKETHRGIPTTLKKKNTKKARTIRNRFNQISFNLPWINDQKRFAGFPGLTGISRKIINFIPKCTYYIEPFAGAAKVYQELERSKPQKFSYAILNDKSEYIYNWLKENFSYPVISKLDFTEIFDTYNFPKSFFLIDAPWFPGFYDQAFSCFDRKTVKEYDLEVLKCCNKLDGDFIITTRRENARMLNSGWNNYLLESEYVVCGKYPKTLLTTNLKLELEKVGI